MVSETGVYIEVTRKMSDKTGLSRQLESCPEQLKVNKPTAWWRGWPSAGGHLLVKGAPKSENPRKTCYLALGTAIIRPPSVQMSQEPRKKRAVKPEM